MTYYVYCVLSTFLVVLVVLSSPLAWHMFMFAIESDSIRIVHSIDSSRSPQLGLLVAPLMYALEGLHVSAFAESILNVHVYMYT
jgi:hypothetical protein